ncbi:hypothetical protein AC578_8794 [Pseudocercospora eumusae]|uniref:Uncharacterized protein n=1 Tax=Pseudocercospora eumusae TaxID=321146 RepID=A0A139H6D4_9PEZI|nr:hypothetical protein AC578_8794 [Pseudocercospora eumusae]
MEMITAIWCHGAETNGLHIGFPLASAILEAQQILYRFLRCRAEVIVDDTKCAKGDGEWKKLVKAGWKASGQLECWSVVGNQAFYKPIRFDIRKCLEKAEVQLRQYEEHIRFLQTDPQYFQTYFRAREQQYRLHYSKAWESLALESTQTLRFLRMIVSHCQYAFQVYEELGQPATSFRQLPEKYERVLSTLLSTCDAAYYHYLGAGAINRMLAMHPEFSQNLRYTKRADGGVLWQHKKEEVYGSQECALYLKDRLHWGSYMLGCAHNSWIRDSTYLMRFLDRSPCFIRPTGEWPNRSAAL